MRKRFLVMAALVLFGAAVLSADIVTFVVTPNAGQFDYALTLQNTGSTGGILFDLFLSLPTDVSKINAGTIGAPVGWGDSAGGLLFFGPDVNPSTSFIEWSADFSTLYDLGIGKSLKGFSFSSSERLTNPIQFSVNGINSFDPAREIGAVPEPSMLLPLSFFVAGLLATVRNRLGDSAGS